MHRCTGAVANIRGCSIKEHAAINAYFENGYSQKLAVRTAGYKGSGAHIWKKEGVKAEIQRRLLKIETDRTKAYDKARKKNHITKERLVNEYAKLAFAPLKAGRVLGVDDDGNQIELIEIKQEQREIGADIPVDARDKKTALDSLAKMEGLFVEHLKISDEREVIDNLMAGRLRAARTKSTEPELLNDGESEEDAQP